MPRRHTYRLLIRWNHRKWGPQMLKSAAEGTSIRRAISNALLSFFSTDQNHQRADAHAAIEVHAWRIRKETAK